MKKDVKVKIVGIQNNGTEEEKIESIAFGEMEEKDGIHHIRYEELSEEGTVLRTFIEYTEDGMKVVKQGDTCSEMVFREGEETFTAYETPYGILEMSMNTFELEREQTDEGVRLAVKYMLSLNGQPTLVNDLQIWAAVV